MIQEYAGDVSPSAAQAALGNDPNSVLIDVRTTPEWQFVGVPDLSGLGKDTLFIEWQSYPHMDINGDFADRVRAEGISEDQQIFLLCRSGVRSVAAAKALTQAGYRHCYNVLEGFEGDKNPEGKRGCTGGWRYHDLPWRQ